MLLLRILKAGVLKLEESSESGLSVRLLISLYQLRMASYCVSVDNLGSANY